MMKQLSLPGLQAPPANPVVNVASVPQRSPFRYPGGKTWLIPKIRQWLHSRTATPGLFVEPFAGGAIVGLTVAFEALAQHVVLVEMDEEVAAVWRVIFETGQAVCLADKILAFNMSIENIEELFSRAPDDL